VGEQGHGNGARLDCKEHQAGEHCAGVRADHAPADPVVLCVRDSGEHVNVISNLLDPFVSIERRHATDDLDFLQAFCSKATCSNVCAFRAGITQAEAISIEVICTVLSSGMALCRERERQGDHSPQGVVVFICTGLRANWNGSL
jgi:hypothetical protein